MYFDFGNGAQTFTVSETLWRHNILLFLAQEPRLPNFFTLFRNIFLVIYRHGQHQRDVAEITIRFLRGPVSRYGQHGVIQ